MSDSRKVRDSLVQDACEAQRSGGHEVTPRKNEEFFNEILNRIDRRESEAKHSYTKKPRDKNDRQASEDFDKELSKRHVASNTKTDSLGKYEVFRREIKEEPKKKKTPFRSLPISKQRLVFEKKLLWQRLQLMKSKPEWQNRLHTCIGELMGAKNKFAYAAAVCALNDLVEKSNETFGDWRKLPVQKLYFTGGIK